MGPYRQEDAYKNEREEDQPQMPVCVPHLLEMAEGGHNSLVRVLAMPRRTEPVRLVLPISGNEEWVNSSVLQVVPLAPIPASPCVHLAVASSIVGMVPARTHSSQRLGRGGVGGRGGGRGR